MILTFVRSSSYSSYRLCPHSWWLQYGLGFKARSNIATDRGSIVHKALEILARIKLAQQNGESHFRDAELRDGPITTLLTDQEALDMAWEHYTTGPADHHRWSHRDHDECRRLFEIALTHSGGRFNPRNRTVVQPEQYFDLTIEEPWAAYDYELPDGSRLKGQLALRGTVDLILEHSNGLQYVDWKTGRFWDWAENKPKTVDSLYKDFQMRLYHLALHALYPAHDVITMTIFFLKEGPFTLAFERDEIPETYRRIREWFEHVRDTEIPERRIGPACNTFCPFGTTDWKRQYFLPEGTDSHGYGKSICDHVHDEVQQLGVSRVVAKFADVARVTSYGGGGGQTQRTTP